MKIPDFSNLPVKIRRWKSGKHQTIEIRRDFITVSEKGLFSNNWSEPVFAFKGVLRRTYTDTGGGEHFPSRTHHEVYLVHPDKNKTLLVYKTTEGTSMRKLWEDAYKTTEEKGIRKLWEDAARALNLPALDEADEEIVARAPADLDKSIRDLAAEGKISVGFDPNATPPRGIERSQIRGEMSIILGWGANEISSDINRGVLSGIIFFVALVLLALIGVIVSEGIKGFIFVLIFLLFLTLGFKEWFLDWIGKRCILITPKEVMYFRETPLGTFNRKVIPFQELKAVQLMQGKLIIASDATKILIGRLGKPQQHWLRNFIRYAIIDSTR